MATPYDIDHLAEVGSTQDAASQRRAASGRATLVIADRQTSGRGRSGRVWLEPDTAMYSSLALARPWPNDRLTLLPLATAIAVRRTLVALGGVTVDLKWPNDLLRAGRKVGGILVEASGDDVVIGCGVNLTWSRPPSFAIAVNDDDANAVGAPELASGWVDELLRVLDAGPDGWPRSEYVDACATLGSQVAWDGGTGLASSIDAVGGLVVETSAGTETVIAGDVHLRADL